MINDDELKLAAAAAADIMIDNLPDPDECPHQFSTKFNRKMNRLMRRANHPYVYQALRIAVCFLLVASITFGAALTFSPDVRAAVIGWVKTQCDGWFEYSFHGEATVPDGTEYYPTWIPDGFTLVKSLGNAGKNMYIYTNDKNQILKFTCLHNYDNPSFFIDTVNYEKSNTTVNGSAADIYIYYDDSKTNAIVYSSSFGDTLFCISAPLDKADLIKMAESIVKK